LALATPSPLATIHSPLFSGNLNTINLHVLMVLSIGGIVNAVLIPELVIFEIHSQPHDFKW